jgi:phenylacetate-CoA ligase
VAAPQTLTRSPSVATKSYWNPAIETMPAATLAVMQQRLLKRQAAYLWRRSEFYRAAWLEAGIQSVDDIQLEDLHGFPLTTKAALRESLIACPPLGYHQAAPMAGVIRVHASSGTTGQPTYMGITRGDHDIWTESVSRVFWAAGFRPDDVYAHCLPLGMFVGGLPLQCAVENIGSTFFSPWPGGTDRLVTMMEQLSATVLCSTPSYVRRLTEYVQQELSTDPRSLGVRVMALGAEPGTEVYRPELEATWGCTVVETAGNSDVLPLFYADCELREGMHMLVPDYLYVELVDPVTKAPVAWEEGAEGGLVYTALEREASPVFRLESNDHVVVAGTGTCQCGRTTPRLRIVGRYDDMMIVGGLNVFPSAIAEVLGQLPPEMTTGAFRIVRQDDAPAQRALVLRVAEPTPDLGGEDRARLETRIADVVKESLGLRPVVELVPAHAVAAAEFKTKYVEDAQ